MLRPPSKAPALAASLLALVLSMLGVAGLGPLLLGGLLASTIPVSAAHAGETVPVELREAIRGLGNRSRTKVRAHIETLGRLSDPRALPALQALADGELRVDKDGEVYILDPQSEALRFAIGGDAADIAADALDKPRINNSIRRALKPVIAGLQLRVPDRNTRLAAAEALAATPSPHAAEAIRAALGAEKDYAIRDTLELALARIDLSSEDRERRLAALAVIGEHGGRANEGTLQALLGRDDQGEHIEPEAIRKAAKAALASIGLRTFWADAAGNFFYGLSLASVLLLAALGLAITFGLMRVINMAHGEMLMIGAYTTYFVQGLFVGYLPDWLDLYVLAALPSAFVVCGLVGMAMERSVIRHLYGRPLETLLATWGISLILIQTVRLVFGAQNVEVANPSWLSGGYEVFQGIVLPWSRIAIVIFSMSVVVVVWSVLQRTPLGLHVRAVTQNREMAACLGIATSRVDTWTFGLGSAIAGLGGVALSQIGNVGPELGQSYIVDSFLVVVIGGVGKLAGTVLAALSLGLVNKFLEPVAGAVFGKILVLLFIIIFIQRRPQGIFALRGRAAEA